MDKEELENKLKLAELKYTEHSLFQMKLRHIPKNMIAEFLKDKRPFDFIIEKDPRGKKYTVGYAISNSRDLYITLKFKNEDIYIITAIVSSKKVIDNIMKFKNEDIYIITAIVSSKKVIDNIRKRMGKWTKRRF